MEQYFNHPTELFRQVLAPNANPAETSYQNNLETLLHSFPQTGVLRALLARRGGAGELSRAAAWYGSALKKVVTEGKSLSQVAEHQIIIRNHHVARPETAVNQPIAEVTLPQPETEPFTIATPGETVEAGEETELIFEVDSQIPAPDNLESAEAGQPVQPELSLAPITAGADQKPLADTQKLIIENIAATDYFVFDRAFVDHKENEQQAAAAAKQVDPEPEPLAAEEQKVTRYHDDKMPYSFMWWLDKTRREYSTVYQPYASPQHIQASLQQLHSTIAINRLESEERKREDAILERFIQEEPQIKPPSSDKLDNENKAKRSSEDQDELITETLARIYTDQMLYSKAIAAYKILMLKNPEKSRYFASQIEILEKKIN